VISHTHILQVISRHSFLASWDLGHIEIHHAPRPDFDGGARARTGVPSARIGTWQPQP
jgi:hypothetical protein